MSASEGNAAEMMKRGESSNKVIKWSHELVTSLIELLRTYENLWKVSNANYKNRTERAKSLQHISQTLGIDKQAVEKKIHNIRCQFRNERRKEKKKCGAGVSDCYQSRWEFYNALKFLYAEEDEDSNLDSLGLIEVQDKHESEETPRTDSPNYVPSTLTASPSTSASSSYAPKSKNKRKNSELEEQAALNSLNRCLSILEKPADEHQIFGDFVANELRGINNICLRKKLKRLIQKDILLVTELDNQANAAYTRVIQQSEQFHINDGISTDGTMVPSPDHTICFIEK